MPKRSIRFGVGSKDSFHSATWNLWTETSGGNSEVYLACRELGGVLKASMHESGNWHIAFNQNAYTEMVEGAVPRLKNHFADKWPRPPEIASGITLAYRIVTPEWAVSSNSEVNNSDKVVWIPVPPVGTALEIHIVITTPNVIIPEGVWPNKESMSTKLIGSIQLNNGDNVWVVSKTIDGPDFSKLGKGTLHFFNGKSESDLQKSKNVRALIFGVNPDGSREIYDVAGNFSIVNNEPQLGK